METQTLPPRLEVISIGSTALDRLAHEGKAWLFASVGMARFLSTASGEVFWLTGAGSPRHRRCIQTASPLPNWNEGAGLDTSGWTLEGHPLGALPPGHPQVWREPALPARAIAPGDLARQAAQFCAHFIATHQPAGWGSLVPVIQNTLEQGKAPPVSSREPPAIPAFPGIERLLAALLKRDHPILTGTAHDLVGLGQGLTPSGDDFLGGLVFCLQILKQAYPQAFDMDWNYPEFIARCSERTNLISYTLLKDNACGHSLAPLHHFAVSLLDGQPLARLVGHAEALVQVGHSTGWDMLTGFLAGCCVSLSLEHTS